MLGMNLAAACPITDDTLRRVEAVNQGFRILRLETDEPPTLRGVIWRLLQEAVQTQRAIKRPGPAPIKSAMPEVYYSAAEIFATEVEMAADQIVYTPRIYERPTAEALGRFVEVMSWLRYVRSRNVPRVQRMMIMLAAGAPHLRVASALGYPSCKAVQSARYHAVGDIEKRLRRDLPHGAF